MAEVLNNIETNRLRNERLLEHVALNTERHPDNYVTLFLSFHPLFSSNLYALQGTP